MREPRSRQRMENPQMDKSTASPRVCKPVVPIEVYAYWIQAPSAEETGVMSIASVTKKGLNRKSYHCDFIVDSSSDDDDAGQLLGYKLSYSGGRTAYQVLFTSWGL